jgi:hypothetical protein
VSAVGQASGRKASSSFFEKKEPKKLFSTLGDASDHAVGEAIQLFACLPCPKHPMGPQTAAHQSRPKPNGKKFFWFFFFKKKNCLPSYHLP